MARPRTNSPDAYSLIAVESGWWTEPNGTEHSFRAGETIISSDHPLFKANPAWWTPIDPLRSRPDVEQATAGPGEIRG